METKDQGVNPMKPTGHITVTNAQHASTRVEKKSWLITQQRRKLLTANQTHVFRALFESCLPKIPRLAALASTIDYFTPVE